ncbi:replication restart DNA helicase PriA [Thermosyntropha lipolytica DSM 11003]|uniref:Replication restart protein PriA n=1 Tax=Thermosyntropha lipolytica DSM 11003 TaxID=1123382 RepID=A0A1M5QHH5_9FIRM|nr:primosomal protein N' [Thermosyntropha lipolytica]SHH12983.1 replication restart DNA helicase PriA [Thermosyntropha lipolytica DSM 11003]
MKYVDVLIDIADSRADHIYTYSVPPPVPEKELTGRRVLVEWGKKKREGYIIRERDFIEQDITHVKPVIKILDREPVFDSKMLELAAWIAQTYLCSLVQALRLIVPRAITGKKDKVVLPNVKEEEMLSSPASFLVNKYLPFFEELWQREEISLKEARKKLGKEVLELLAREGLILVAGVYAGYKPLPGGYVYRLAGFEVKELSALRKKAPRQAEVLALLMEKGEIAAEQLEKTFARSTIEALLNKGYIKKVKKDKKIFSAPFVLTEEQERAVEMIVSRLEEGYREFLLYGVTGSGKSEIYLRAAQACIEKGKKVMVLVPEIALTRHLVEMFALRIPGIAVMHSGMTRAERYEEWKRIKNGEASLVLGTRSAVFAPLSDLGLIIVDEEQETSYKQEETPRYHAVEVARRRAQMEDALLLLGSATPSLETFHRAMEGKSELIKLSRRIGNAVMPVIYIEDMRLNLKRGPKHNLFLSDFLYNKIEDNLKRGKQCILFLNRRGYAWLTVCTECGNIVLCPHCSVGMTYHQDIKRNLCHYCNFTAPVPSLCTRCGSRYLQQIGFGTQRLEEELKRLFPGARIKRLDIDISRKREEPRNILQAMQRGEIDILIGTQMIAKGFNFPSVSLVGIVDADGMLNLPDFRAGERAFQLIVQAAGRAGRGEIPGEVVIQTYQPDNLVINLAAKQDYMSFYLEEIRLRKILNYPPFTNILRLVVSDEEEKLCQAVINELADYIGEITDAKEERIEILGPAPCPIKRLRDRFRYQLMVKCENIMLLRSIGRFIIDNKERFPSKTRIEIDINPLMTM